MPVDDTLRYDRRHQKKERQETRHEPFDWWLLRPLFFQEKGAIGVELCADHIAQKGRPSPHPLARASRRREALTVTQAGMPH